MSKMSMLDWEWIIYGPLGILNIIGWIFIIRSQKRSGIYAFLTWLFLTLFFLTLIYKWESENELLPLILVAVVFSTVTLTLTLRIRSIPSSLLPVLQTTTVLTFITLSIFFSFGVGNPNLYMFYKAQFDNEFHYPPGYIFNKKVDWLSFFRNHSDRNEITKALVYYFYYYSYNDEFNDVEFRNGLFKAWDKFDVDHEARIEFPAEELIKRGGLYALMRRCSDNSFLLWWVKEVDNEPSQLMHLRAYVEQIIVSLQNLSEKERSVAYYWVNDSLKSLLKAKAYANTTDNAALKKLFDRDFELLLSDFIPLVSPLK